MGKKDKKSKTAEQKARVMAKQTKKAAQKDKKAKSKGAEDSDADDVDLQAVLEEYSRQQAQFLKVSESLCEPPSPRSSASLVGSPASNKELFLFGGEYYNGALATFFNDLFIYLIDKNEWRRVTSPNSPLPRSGHAWCRSGNATSIYLFGGEFSSPKQGTFYHYNDFWRLEPSTREWTRLESKGKGPPARSGHRMTYFKNYIVLFGGFQDTSQTTKYLQDLWIYDCQAYTWHNVNLPPASQKPDARSSFSFLPHDAGAVLTGGYSRIKSTVAAGKQTKGSNQGTRSILKPVVHQDTWFLRITQPASDAPANASPTARWERRKLPANRPNPPRAGVNMVYHKGRGILFGGVHDVEESEEGLDSEFFDTLYAWNIDRNRFFQLNLRRTKTAPKRQPDDRGMAKRDRGKADEVELLRNLAALETNGSIVNAASEDVYMDTEMIDAPMKPVKPVQYAMPHARFNAHLAIQDDILYILGGTYEHGDVEHTFDDMWAIDLGKLDGVREVYRRELDNWQGSNEEEEESDAQSESEESEDEDVDEGGVQLDIPTQATGQPAPEALIEADQEQTEILADTRPQPRPFESLREFFSRTSVVWQDIVLERLRQESAVDRSIKEIRKTAFEMSESKWWDSREEVTALEDEQEEAGIGEVVNLAERSKETSSAGRRR